MIHVYNYEMDENIELVALKWWIHKMCSDMWDG